MKTLKFIFVALFVITLFNCEKEEIQEINQNNQTKALFPDYGYIDADFDLPAIRGWVRIYNTSPCFSNGVQVPCDPLVETVIPCQYPNGFCYVEYVSGTPSTGGGTGVLVDYDEVRKNTTGIIEITLPERQVATEEQILDQLNNDPEVTATDKEGLASQIATTFSFGEDTSLSQELVSYYRENSDDQSFSEMHILARDYLILYDNQRPNGYIKALVRVN